MKKILIILGIFISTLSFSQVDNQTIVARYMEFYEYNSYSNEFEEISAFSASFKEDQIDKRKEIIITII